MEIWAILPEWVFSTQASAWQILSFDDWPQIYQTCSRLCQKILLISFFMNEFLLSTIIWINRHYVFSINLYYFLAATNFILSLIWKVLSSLNVIISISCVKRENTLMTFCCQPNLLQKLVTWMIRLSHISLQKTMGKNGTDSVYTYIKLWF